MAECDFVLSSDVSMQFGIGRANLVLLSVGREKQIEAERALFEKMI